MQIAKIIAARQPEVYRRLRAACRPAPPAAKRNVVVGCNKGTFIFAVPARGTVDLAQVCGLCQGGCIFAPFMAQDAPDMIF